MINSVAELDVRSLAATARAVISPVHESVLGKLDQFIARADGGESVTIEQLVELLEGSCQQGALPSLFPLDANPTRGGPTDPPRPRTREFGPRPARPEQATPVELAVTPDTNRRRVVGLMLLSILLLAVMTFGSGPGANEPFERASLDERMSAAQSLAAANAAWDADHGVLTIELDDQTRTFATGQPGDLAAIADWNCDGDSTLGVYRPDTGAWFIFDSWTSDSSSLVRPLGNPEEADTSLVVQVDGSGCAHPVLG